MVPYVDIELTMRLAKALKGVAEVVFAAPDVARQGLIKKAESKKENLPGVTVFRTASEPDESQTTMFVKDTGYAKEYTEDYTKLITQRHKPVKARYSISCFVRKLTELVDIERILQFFDVYAPIVIMYDGQEQSFFVEVESPIYIPWSYPDSGKVYGYRMDLEIVVSTAWVLEKRENVVNTIESTIYSTLAEGNFITDKLIEEWDKSSSNVVSKFTLKAEKPNADGSYQAVLNQKINKETVK